MSKWIRRNIWLMPIVAIVILMLLKRLEIFYPSEAEIANFFSQDFWVSTSFGEYLEERFGTGSSIWLWLLPLFSALVLWKLFISKSSSSGGGLLDGISKIMNAFTFCILICVFGGGALLILVAVLSLIFAFLHIWGIVDKNGLPLFLSDISIDHTTYLVSFLSPFVL
jgi:hypothetical protein